MQAVPAKPIRRDTVPKSQDGHVAPGAAVSRAATVGHFESATPTNAAAPSAPEDGLQEKEPQPADAPQPPTSPFRVTFARTALVVAKEDRVEDSETDTSLPESATEKELVDSQDFDPKPSPSVESESSFTMVPLRDVSPRGKTSADEKAKASADESPASAKPVFAPRTSSLHSAAAAVSPPASTARSSSPEQSWTSFIRSRAQMLGLTTGLRAEEPDSDEEDVGGSWEHATYPGVTSTSRRIVVGSDSNVADPLLSDLDPESVEFLLTRLNIENEALALNPKTIYVEDGSVRGYRPTLSALTSTYSTQAPSVHNAGDEDFWASVIEDHSLIQNKVPHLLSARVRAGVPPHLRAQVWAAMASAHESRFKAVYPLLQKEESPYERIIRRDVPRTYPKLDLFKQEGGEGQEKLFRVLKAYSIYDAEVGYCQGLSFVVGPLLLQDMSETQAFAVLVRLLEATPPSTPASSSSLSATPRVYALRSLFEPDMSGLHKLLHAHAELVRTYLPNLHAHFSALGVTATMYASQWFLTLFSYGFFPLDYVFRVYDLIFADGAVETMLRVSLGILKRNEKRLLKEDEFEDCLDCLKGEGLYDAYADDPESIVKDAVDCYDLVSASTLKALDEKYAEDQRKRTKLVSETELVGLQALIRNLRVDASRGAKQVAALTDENAALRLAMQEALAEAEREREAANRLRQTVKELQDEMARRTKEDIKIPETVAN
ncbi:hypothetical protein HDU86_003792 [Geranomyces michiganensis]|nr:hypothetical protein HDU86_003792 [Geranomyces michiganensis]